MHKIIINTIWEAYISIWEQGNAMVYSLVHILILEAA